MDTLDTIEYRGYKILIRRDEDPQNPRNDCNIGTMVCFHSRYDLGDKHDYELDDVKDDERLPDEIENGVYLPIFLLDHGNLSLSTDSFTCRWDSGQVGWIVATRESL